MIERALASPVTEATKAGWGFTNRTDVVTFVTYPYGPAPCDEFLPANGYADIGDALADPYIAIPVSTGNVMINHPG